MRKSRVFSVGPDGGTHGSGFGCKVAPPCGSTVRCSFARRRNEHRRRSRPTFCHPYYEDKDRRWCARWLVRGCRLQSHGVRSCRSRRRSSSGHQNPKAGFAGGASCRLTETDHRCVPSNRSKIENDDAIGLQQCLSSYFTPHESRHAMQQETRDDRYVSHVRNATERRNHWRETTSSDLRKLLSAVRNEPRSSRRTDRFPTGDSILVLV